jgi:hypothetical protein
MFIAPFHVIEQANHFIIAGTILTGIEIIKKY